MRKDKIRRYSASSSFSGTGIAYSYLKELTTINIESNEPKTARVPYISGGYILVNIGTKIIPSICAIAEPLPIITIPLRRGSVEIRAIILVLIELKKVFIMMINFLS
jgi:hypothetical protein